MGGRINCGQGKNELLMKKALHIKSETPSDILNKDRCLDIHGAG